jgi:molybdate transport system substrate-binding protein
VFGVTIPDSENHVAHYPIAELATSTHHAAASAFIEYVNSAAGQAILARFGFGTK